MMSLAPALLTLVVAARGETVAVVETESTDALLGLAAQVTNAIVAEAKSQGYTVLGPEELQKKLDEKKLTALRKCGGKLTCATPFLQELGVKKAVLGTLGRDERNYLLKLWLVDVPGMAIVADVDRPILIAARRFQKDVQQAVPPLLRGEREARGTLVIESSVADTQVTMNGEFLGVAPLTQTLRPGKYEVKLERKKYLPITRLLAVEANQETKETFKLLLKPGEIPDEEVVPALVKQGPATTEGKPLQLSALTFGAAGLTLVAAGVGTGFGVAARNTDNRLLAGYDTGANTWAGTRADALAAKQNALFANVGFGVAAAALVGTVVSLVLDVNASAAPVQVAPTASAGGGGFVVGGQF